LFIGLPASHDIVRFVRKIDIFNHIYPAAFHTRLMQIAPDYKDIGKRMRGIPMLADLDVRFRVMDTFDDYQQVLSLPTPPLENVVQGKDAQELARAANDGMAELVGRYPDRFPAFVHQRARRADVRRAVPADLRCARLARPSDLDASVPRRGDGRLQERRALRV
jgi:hypothetical protein